MDCKAQKEPCEGMKMLITLIVTYTYVKADQVYGNATLNMPDISNLGS